MSRNPFAQITASMLLCKEVSVAFLMPFGLAVFGGLGQTWNIYVLNSQVGLLVLLAGNSEM